MNRVMNIMVIALALVFLMEVGSGWAEEYEKVLVPTKTGEWIELTLVPEEYVVNRARSQLGDYEDYLLVPIYGLEDQILSYFVIFSKGDLKAKDMKEIYQQQISDNQLLLDAVDAFLEGSLDEKSFHNTVAYNMKGLFMKDYYTAGYYSCFFELKPFGYGGMLPLPFYWMAVKYLESIYHEEPEFKCFRHTDELRFCYEFEIGGENILMQIEPYFSYIEIKKKEECHTFSGKTNKYDPSKIEENIEKWEKYSF